MKQVLHKARWIGIVFSMLGGALSPECAAGLLALRGTATVATVQGDFIYDGTVRSLPFAALVGDTFTFYLSMESRSAGPDQPSGQAYFHATIDGAKLRHSQLEVFVTNDQGVRMLALAEPADVDHPALVGDAVLINQPPSFGARDYLGTVDVTDSPRFRVEIGFLQYVLRTPPGELQIYPNVLNNWEVPQGAATWQAFSDRELVLWFENRSFLGAYITDVTSAPEASTLSLSLLGWCGLSWLRRRRPHRMTCTVSLQSCHRTAHPAGSRP